VFREVILVKAEAIRKLEYIDEKPDFETAQQDRQSGYSLGFVVSLAKDFGIKVDPHEVPQDNQAYEAFAQAIKGEPRLLPYEIFLMSEGQKRDFSGRQRDESAYLLGLTVWLKSQGIDGVDNWQIRHPVAFEGF
jgi:hypothetical protein